MSVPWHEVRSWLETNNIGFELTEDAGMQRIRIDLTKNDAFGGFDRTHVLYTHPSATMQAIGSFSEEDVEEAATELRISWP